MTPLGSITDVAGIGVGHHQRIGRGWQTGTTVIACAGGAVPGVDVRGGGPGTRETDALRPENVVQRIHAVCLTGGSAYGLAAVDGVVQTLEGRHLGFPVGVDQSAVVPVVPGAVIFDLGRGGAFGNRPDATFGARAARAALARRSTPRWGAVGAGTGAVAGGLQGGVGTASALVPRGDDLDPIVVGAVAVVNASGSPIDPATGLPWQPSGLRFRRPSIAEREALRSATARPEPTLNTTIGLVATSAELDKPQVTKMAAVAHDGLARAVRPAHSMVDGETVFGLATGEHELESSTPTNVPGRPGFGEDIARITLFNDVLRTSADVFAAACTHAVISAATIGDAPAWGDLAPSAQPG